jgi:hypothetical protein
MTGINPFDPERDAALGAMLRDALTGADQAGFLARVRASVALTRQERTFDVLARWLRPNVAAAAAAVMMLGAALWWYQAANTRGAGGTATVAELLVSDSVPAQEILIAGLLETR